MGFILKNVKCLTFGPAQRFPNNHDVTIERRQRTGRAVFGICVRRTTPLFWIYRVDGETGQRTRVGAGSKTLARATALRHRMRAQQPVGSSTWFTLPERESALRSA